MSETGRIVLAAALAAGTAYVLNLLVLRESGNRAIARQVPWIEEAAKTGWAWLLQASLIPVHLGFGIIEAIYDITRPSRTRYFSGFLSLLTHGAYGAVTWVVAVGTGSQIAGLLTGGLVHWLWNSVILKLTRHTSS